MVAIVAPETNTSRPSGVVPAVSALPSLTFVHKTAEAPNAVPLVSPATTPRDGPVTTIATTTTTVASSVDPNHNTKVATMIKPSLLPLAVANAALVSAAAVSQVVLPVPVQANKISPPTSPRPKPTLPPTAGVRLNKFVRRLHDMLQSEQNSGIVEWRRGLLVLHSTDAFAKTILPKYFNTRNFKTFRRQLNYYGFVHVRSFSTTGSTTTALWVNRDLAKNGNASISSVLLLKRVEPCESAKTAEGRRVRKELAVSTVEEEIGVSAKSLQLDQIRSMALRRDTPMDTNRPPIPLVVTCHAPPPEGVLSQPPLLPIPSTTEVSDSSADSCDTMSVEDNTCAANLLLLLSKGVPSS